MTRRRWQRMGLWALAAAGAVLAAGGDTQAADAVRLAASTVSIPAGGGWTEVVLVLENGPRPWRGVVQVAGAGAKAHVRLSIPARGQRVVSMPVWIGPGTELPKLWIDGVEAGTVSSPPAAGQRARVVIAELDRQAASEPLVEDAAMAVRLGLARLPETWRAYEAFDLVVLPVGGYAALRPAQESALEEWVRWGGALGLKLATDQTMTTAKPVGMGTAIVGDTADEIRGGFARWKREALSGDDPARLAVEAWERSWPFNTRSAFAREGAGPSRSGASSTGGALGRALGGYLAVMLVAALVVARFPRSRGPAVHVLLAVIVGGSLTVWGIARAGSAQLLEVREVTLIRAYPGITASHMSSAVGMKAERAGVSRFVPSVTRPSLSETAAPRAQANPHRAIQWDVDGGFWERAWALGETATLRVDGLLPDLGIRARPAVEAGTWTLTNTGRHTLRRVLIMARDGRVHPLPDLLPAGQASIGSPAESAAAWSRPRPDEPALAFWRSFLARPGATAGEALVLLAALDPPAQSLRFPDGDARVSSQSHLVMALPGAPPRGAR